MDEKLIEAAEQIESNFIRNRLTDDRGGLCMVGAIRLVHTGSAWRDIHELDAERVLLSIGRIAAVIPPCKCDRDEKPPMFNVSHYNDEHCDGGVEAAKLLREAAEVEL